MTDSDPSVQFLYSGQVCTDNLSPTRIISLLGAAQKFQVLPRSS